MPDRQVKWVLRTPGEGVKRMEGTTSVSILVTCAAGIAAVLLCSCTAAVQSNKDDKKKVAPPYNPYPPGILPGDLN